MKLPNLLGTAAIRSHSWEQGKDAIDKLIDYKHNKIKTMETFYLNGKVTISVRTKVQAETIEEAIEIAENRGVVKRHWFNDDDIKYSWVNDVYDGEVFDINDIKFTKELIK